MVYSPSYEENKCPECGSDKIRVTCPIEPLVAKCENCGAEFMYDEVFGVWLNIDKIRKIGGILLKATLVLIALLVLIGILLASG